MMRLVMCLMILILTACGDSDRPYPSCDDVSCVSLSCGTLTPAGLKDPDVCTCGLPDGSYVTCVAE